MHRKGNNEPSSASKKAGCCTRKHFSDMTAVVKMEGVTQRHRQTAVIQVKRVRFWTRKRFPQWLLPIKRSETWDWGDKAKGPTLTRAPIHVARIFCLLAGYTHSFVVSFEGQSDDETTKTRIRITSRVRVFGLKFNVLHEPEGLQTNSYQPVNRFDRRSRKKSRSACGNKWIRCSTTNMFWAPQQICYVLGSMPPIKYSTRQNPCYRYKSF